MATMTNATSLPETIATAIGKGGKRNDIVKTLCNSGFQPQAAQEMVDAAVKNYPARVRAGALAQMGTGLLLFAIGLAITVGTMAMHSPIILISWGPMVFGVVRILRGLFRLVTA